MKILFGSIVVDARGRLNGHVFKKTAFGHSVSKLALPRNNKVWQTNKALQLNALIFKRWASVPTVNKNVFEQFALDNLQTNKFGQRVNIGGRNMFTKLAQSLSFKELVLPDVNDLSNQSPFLEITGVRLTDGTGTVNYIVDKWLDDTIVKGYFQWLPSSRNKMPQNGWKRFTNVVVESSGTVIFDVDELVNTRAFNQGKNLFFKLEYVNKFGYGSEVVIIKAVVI